MMKKMKILGWGILMVVSAVLLLPQNSFAEGCSTDHFMNLPAWYDGLDGEMNEDGGCSIKTPATQDDLKKYIWTIALNIASIIFGVAGYLAVIFVMIGGFMYMTSQGEPAKAAGAKKAIMNALIGVVLCALASTIAGAINTIANRAAEDNGANFFPSIMNTALVWSGIICVIFIIIGGINYTTSSGDPGKAAKAKNSIFYAVMGLVITIVAALIVNTVLKAL